MKRWRAREGTLNELEDDEVDGTLRLLANMLIVTPKCDPGGAKLEEYIVLYPHLVPGHAGTMEELCR